MTTKLGSGYIDLTVNYGSALKQMTGDFTKLEQHAAKASKNIGKDFSSGMSVAHKATENTSKSVAALSGHIQTSHKHTNLLSTALTGLRGTGSVFDGMTSGASRFVGVLGGAKGVGVLGTVAAVTAAVGLATVALEGLGHQWDTISDRFVVRTGAMGAQLDSLVGTVKRVGADVGVSLDKIGDTSARLAQSLHLVGKPLDDLTRSVVELQHLTGEQINVLGLAKAFHVLGVNVEKDGVAAVDSLLNASRATGLTINELIDSIGSAGVATANFKLSFGETAALITTFTRAGLSADKVKTGLAMALKNLSKEDVATEEAKAKYAEDQAKWRQKYYEWQVKGSKGKPPEMPKMPDLSNQAQEPLVALGDRITEIKALLDSKDPQKYSQAIVLATKTFGKGYADFLKAIASNELNADTLKQNIDALGPGVHDTYLATADWREELQKIQNVLKTELKPEADKLFGDINKWVTEHKEDIKKIFIAGIDAARTLLRWLGNIGDVLGKHPGLVKAVVFAFVGWETIKGITTVVTGLSTTIALLGRIPGVAAVAGSALWAAFLGPASIILALVAALMTLGLINPMTGQEEPTTAQQNQAFIKDAQGQLHPVPSGVRPEDMLKNFPGGSIVESPVGPTDFGPSGGNAPPGSTPTPSPEAGLPPINPSSPGGWGGGTSLPGIPGGTPSIPAPQAPSTPSAPGGNVPAPSIPAPQAPSAPTPQAPTPAPSALPQTPGGFIGPTIGLPPIPTWDTGGLLGRDFNAHSPPKNLDQGGLFNIPGGGAGMYSGITVGVEPPHDSKSVAKYIYNAAIARGYTPAQAMDLVAYAAGESSLDPTRSGGIQGGSEVLGLFQEQPQFVSRVGLNPETRNTVVTNVEAYLRNLEPNRNLPWGETRGIGTGALATTSGGGPLGGTRDSDQPWEPLIGRARNELGALPSNLAPAAAILANPNPANITTGALTASPVRAPMDESAIRTWAQNKFGIANTFGTGKWENWSHEYDTGWHHRGLGGAEVPSGYAFDFAGTPEQMSTMANWIANNMAGQTLELIHQGPGFDPERNIRNGQFGSGPYKGILDQHTTHVHWATDTPPWMLGFDEGGFLPPGMSIVINETGQPEIVFNQDQMDGLSSFIDANAGQSQQQPLPSVLRTQGYIPAGAGAKGQAGSSFMAGIYGLGADVINWAIDQGAQLAVQGISMAASAAAQAGVTGGSMGMDAGAGGAAAGSAAGAAAGAAANLVIGQAAKIAKMGVDYGAQLLGIWTDAWAEINSPFGVPRFFQTDPTQFMPQWKGLPTAVTTGEKAMLGDQNLPPGGPIQPGQMPGQQPWGPPVEQAKAGGISSLPIDLGFVGDLIQLGIDANKPPVQPVPAPGQETPEPAPTPEPMPEPPPQTPSPMNDMIKDFFGFDEGGWFEPNTLGINASSRPEPVLSTSQWSDIEKIAGAVPDRLNPMYGTNVTNDYRVILENVTVKDVRELERQMNDRRKIQVMRHAGRPSMGGA